VHRFERRLRNPHRVVVVKRGDSLWSISWRLLGQEASVAQVAREVGLVWAANAGRIGSGDPDVVMPGTRIWVP
jgi:nucleoid-associated protein YgaU